MMRRGLSATKIASQGGFLRRGSVTILSGVEDNDVDTVMTLTQEECRARVETVPTQGLPLFGDVAMATSATPFQVRVGGAAVFVLPVDRFDRF